MISASSTQCIMPESKWSLWILIKIINLVLCRLWASSIKSISNLGLWLSSCETTKDYGLYNFLHFFKRWMVQLKVNGLNSQNRVFYSCDVPSLKKSHFQISAKLVKLFGYMKRLRIAIAYTSPSLCPNCTFFLLQKFTRDNEKIWAFFW